MTKTKAITLFLVFSHGVSGVEFGMAEAGSWGTIWLTYHATWDRMAQHSELKPCLSLKSI